MSDKTGRVTMLLDSLGSVVYANSVALSLLEAAAVSVQKRRFWSEPGFSDEQGRERIENAFTAALQGKETSFVVIHSDIVGGKYCISFSAALLQDTDCSQPHVLFDGNVCTLCANMPTMVSSEDDTDGRFLSLIRNGLVLDALYDMVIFLNSDQTVTDVKCEVKGSLFVKSDDPLGKRLKNIIKDSGLLVEIEEALKKCSHPLGVQRFEYFLSHESVHHYFEVCVAYTSINEAVITFSNISEQKQAQARLIETKKMDSIGALAGGIAHDFNNMLGGIAGYTNLLVTMEEDPHKIEYLQLINKAVKKAATMTQDLLVFGRRLKGRMIQIDVGQMVRQVLSIFKFTSEKRINIEVEIEEELPGFVGDPGQLNQVILNLLQNASEAISENGTIAVCAHRVECHEALVSYFDKKINGNYILIEISDSGEGIGASVLPRIFEPFFSTKDESKIDGRGLGLASVWGIINGCGGHIDVISQTGKGTTFMVYLPVQ